MHNNRFWFLSNRQTIYIFCQNPGGGIPVSSFLLTLFSNLHFLFAIFFALNTVNNAPLTMKHVKWKKNYKHRCTKITLYYPRQMYVYLKYLTLQISQNLLSCRAIQKAWNTLHSVGLLFHFFFLILNWDVFKIL